VKINYTTKNIVLGFVLMLIVVVILLYMLPAVHLSLWWTLGCSLLILLIFKIILKHSNNFVSGLVGENDIEDELKSIGPGFFIFNKGLDTGRGNIDKIVIGPTGVWTLEVKSHNANVTFDGNVLLNWGKPFIEGDFLKQAYGEAKTLQDLIKSKLNIDIKVQSALIFSNKFAKVRFGLNKQMGVYVIQIKWLKKLLTETYLQSLDNSTMLKIKELLNTG
jgi:hypothetical protein